jgi:hypothetical protein
MRRKQGKHVREQVVGRRFRNHQRETDLQVIARRDQDGDILVRVRCLRKLADGSQCGRESEARWRDVRSGHTRSCGCWKKKKYKDFIKGLAFRISTATKVAMWSDSQAWKSNSKELAGKYRVRPAVLHLCVRRVEREVKELERWAHADWIWAVEDYREELKEQDQPVFETGYLKRRPKVGSKSPNAMSWLEAILLKNVFIAQVIMESKLKAFEHCPVPRIAHIMNLATWMMEVHRRTRLKYAQHRRERRKYFAEKKEKERVRQTDRSRAAADDSMQPSA